MYSGGRSCQQYNEIIKSLTFIENLTKLVMQEMAQKDGQFTMQVITGSGITGFQCH